VPKNRSSFTSQKISASELKKAKETIRLQVSSKKEIAQDDDDHFSSITTTFPKIVSF
jgi:hypothetical protein